MKWYYAKGGSQQGPVSTEDLQAKVSSGELAASDLIWRDGMKDWLPVSQVGDFASFVPGAGASPQASAPASPAVPAAPAQTTDSPYAAPQNPYGSTTGPGTPIPNYLWQAIVVTILCCWPFGIPAIVFAAKVDGLVAQGRYAEARDASDKAKMWSWISFGSALVFIVGYILLVVVAGVANA
jgi:hypothetical protein